MILLKDHVARAVHLLTELKMSRSRNTSRRMPKRPIVLPAIGDPSPTRPEPYNNEPVIISVLRNEKNGISIDEQLQGMTESQKLELMLALGGSATDFFSVEHCYNHVDMLAMEGRPVHGIRYSEDVLWCRNCFRQFRYKKGK